MGYCRYEGFWCLNCLQNDHSSVEKSSTSAVISICLRGIFLSLRGMLIALTVTMGGGPAGGVCF